MGMSQGPGEKGMAGPGGEGASGDLLAAGHGAMALTVYSACFFPYHFIHFLNSRSMVCKGMKPDNPSETQDGQRGRGCVSMYLGGRPGAPEALSVPWPLFRCRR